VAPLHRFPRLIRSSSAAKPRVLLVDNHRGILEMVSAVLADDFDVAGAATDGRQAIDAARRIAPDLIVLDINMPGLDGFQTKHELDRAGSHAPVVFLSTVEEDAYVIAAFRCGGRGYVLKPRLARDLASALDLALHDRLFVPSLTSLFGLVDRDGHAMQLYGDAGSFLDRLAAFLDLALRRGDATCVIGAENIRDGLDWRLRDAGWDIDGPFGQKHYRVLDTADTLRGVMRNGLPDAGRVAEIASELDQYRRAVSVGARSRLTLFGDVAAALIADGNPAAAIELESQWNSLTHGLPFFTVCGYSASSLHDCTPDVWSKACLEHRAVSHANNL
jgi:CheY-like chemotaxis protein